METGVVAPPTCIQSKTDWDDENRRRRKYQTERHNERSQSTSTTLSEDDNHGTRNCNAQKVSASEKSGLISSEAEAVSACKSRDSWKDFQKSKKPEVLRLVIDRLSTASNFISYHLVERLLLYDDHIAKHVAKWG